MSLLSEEVIVTGRRGAGLLALIQGLMWKVTLDPQTSVGSHFDER
jgi:hypothetical protein